MHTKSKFPESIKNEVNIALRYYPSLENVPIEFKFKKNIKKSVMLAQPTFTSLFKSRENRAYIILISEKFKITGQEFKTINVPKDVLVGWLGHELGHVIDYQTRGNLEMISFGIKYVLLKEHIKEAERTADRAAVERGMADYIIKTKNFILNNAEIAESYKSRIREYYLSPEEIMEMVQEKHEKEN
ncbi:hypothetical protein HME9304_00200 [Flagellimonas maritima]|uniref:Uncharacterized protein n=1 Tax=Flagellimonas maritima TaxID=1383885 RepID=A0A2Z4LN88_9FLAO|nr:hypothetical protein [Allomuricauda aurantiaca]AWX43213.1 hypothetical protein HME9304_00200 [Allomuricauda aurantiaca]